MRLLFLLVLLLGIGVAGFAGYLTFERFSHYESEIKRLEKVASKLVKTTKVVVAKKELKYGDVLEKKNVKLVDFPVKTVPKTTFKSMEELFGKPGEDKPPRIVLRATEASELLSTAKISEFGEDAGVASRLERGTRAFTLRVDVASGVSGFLRPGDRIDIFWTGRVGRQTVSRLILDGIQLIAIDQIANEDRKRPVIARTVTVAVTPQIVGSLVQAQATGKLLLSLRGIGDDTKSGTIEVNQNDLLGREVKEQVKEEVCSIKSRKGGEVTETIIPCADEQ
ncbi:Flp pilus assembly protein CpaB [Amylibacter marinus]|uniref:Flp pilus assembly protein CpaB n=1 Tax=Amylibacter marinus TaxID=1475483 RepID=A0ABQ5VRR1_9RHOB|nr:Flp pilus assembly protein CpaB [Amylibacter marinus]GLQ33797.1 Flp pilus assembly protein CpaB [Amylibacter marinus]